jgi:hypothetical protein
MAAANAWVKREYETGMAGFLKEAHAVVLDLQH